MADRKGNETDYIDLANKYPDIDFNLIGGFEAMGEGGPHLGYWPGTDESGVTVGLGIDLAWTNLKRFNLSAALKTKLAPYTITQGKDSQGRSIEIEGPIGTGAKQIVNKLPRYPGEPQKHRRNLVLTDSEVNQLNLAKGSMIYNNISNDFAQLFPNSNTFANLNPAIKTVIMSLGWQLGENFLTYKDPKTGEVKTPRLLAKMKNAVLNTNDWDPFIEELKTGQWSDSDRRELEGLYLENKLKGNVNGKTR